MICTGVSDILYPGATFEENSCIVCALIVAVCARGHVTLYADNVYVDNVNG